MQASASDRWFARQMRSEFFVFLLVGGFAAGVNVLTRYIFNFWMSYDAAILLAYLCGMTTAFILSRAFVFKGAKDGNGKAQFFRFAIVNIFAAAQVWAISVGLAEYGFPAAGFEWHAHDVAHAIGVAVPAVTSYFGHKWFSFKQSG